MKTAVLIHGFHLDSQVKYADGGARGWPSVVHGVVLPDGRATGRATYGAMLAYRERADLVIFSTGASKNAQGVTEAECAYLAVQSDAARLAHALGIEQAAFLDWMNERVHLDVVSQTTDEELKLNLALCAAKRIERVILVTSVFHAPRALANANVARRGLDLKRMTIMACAPDDLSPPPVIFEAPSRPDRDPSDFRETLSRIFQIPAERRPAALLELKDLIDRYLDRS